MMQEDEFHSGGGGSASKFDINSGSGGGAGLSLASLMKSGGSNDGDDDGIAGVGGSALKKQLDALEQCKRRIAEPAAMSIEAREGRKLVCLDAVHMFLRIISKHSSCTTTK